MSDQDLIENAKQAGFTDQEISDYISKEGGKAIAAGFSQQEVNNHFGIKDLDADAFKSTFQSNIDNHLASQSTKGEQPKPFTVMDAFNVGFSNSTTGLISAGKLPEKQMPEDATGFQKAVSSIGQFYGDAPFIIGGSVVGTMGAAETGPLAPAIGGAMGFGLNESIRQSLMDGYKNGTFKSFDDFYTRALPIAWETAKSAALGAVMPTAGGMAEKAVAGALEKPVANNVISQTTSNVAQETAKVGAEFASMVGLGAAMDKHIPTAQELEDSAWGFVGVVLGVRAVEMTPKMVKGVRDTLADTFVKTGKAPSDVVADAKSHPSIIEDVVNGRVPEIYQANKGQAQGKNKESINEEGVTINPEIITPPEIEQHLKDAFGGDATSLLDAGKIKIVQSVDDLNKATGAEHPDDVQGLHDPSDGSTYLVADNLKKTEEKTVGQVIKGVALHEVGVHVGLKEMLGEDLYGKVLETVANSQEDAFVKARQTAEEYSAKPEHVPEESVAYLVENHPELPFVKQLIAGVRQWVYRKTGGKLVNLTDADITAMALSSLRRQARQASTEASGGIPFYSRNANLGGFKSEKDRLREEQFQANRVFGSSRVGLPHAQILERVPALGESAQKMKDIIDAGGTITDAMRQEHQRLVDLYKPTENYKSVPIPVPPEQAIQTLSVGKSQSAKKGAKYGLPMKTLKEGDPAQLRLDIPSYSNTGDWINSVHEARSKTGATTDNAHDSGAVIGYESVSALTNVTFGMPQYKALKIAQGKAKGGTSKIPIATMMGKWKPVTADEAYAKAQEIIKTNDPAWSQVGMDPERHSSFYDRESHRPLESADEVLQIGSLVLAKNAVYGSREDFMYSRKQSIEERHPVQYTKNLKSILKRAIAEKWDAEKILSETKDVIDKLDTRNLSKASDSVRDKERGELWIKEKLIRAERHGDISPEARSLAEFLINKNPSIVDDLAISIRQGGEGAAGFYTPLNRIITVIKDKNNPLTVAHEILHHTERMMPLDIQKGIRQEWLKQLDDVAYYAAKAQDHELSKSVSDALQGALGNEEARTRVIDQIQDGTLPYDFYALTSPSEFWAVNGARLLNDRANASGWAGKAHQWLKEFVEKIKEVFGLSNHADILRGLDAIYETDGEISGRMLGDAREINYSSKSEEIPYAEGEEIRPASLEDVNKADEFNREYGITPYYSEGQLSVPVDVDLKYSIKKPYNEKDQSKGRGNHPILDLPLNKNGTVTLYFPTTNENARKVVIERKLRADNPQANRIYLTNESSAGKVAENPANIEQKVGGANVLVHIDPSLLHLDFEHEDGRKDFYIPLAEGASYVNKMRQTKLFTLNKSRKDAISQDVTFKDIGDGITTAINDFVGMNFTEKRSAIKQARKILKDEHNVSTLLSENGKLQKTRVGDYGLDYEGNSVASMGLGLASAQKLNAKKLTTCLKSAICEALCLGETSGQNLLYGGEGSFRSGPRLSQYLKTEALVLHPKEFGILLAHEISLFKAWAQRTKGVETVKNDVTGEKEKVPKQVYQAAIRLNVTSDFPPSVFEALIKANPDVQFYDYTKFNTSSVAENHHLTYSSTGVSQIVNGKTIFNPHTNWNRMVHKMNTGLNVAMAFTDRNELPKFVLDEKTGQKFKVWDGDQYDARFLDPKQEDGKGMIIGLTNKDRTTMPGLAAEKHNGFFIDYDPARDGDTVTIKDQSQFKPEPSQSFTSGSDVKFSRSRGKTPQEQAVLDRVSQEDGKRRPLTLAELYRINVDDLNPVKDVAPESYKLLRLARGVYGKVDQFLKYGTFDYRTLTTNGESLNDILGPIKHDLDSLRAYMVSKRAVEQESKGLATGMPMNDANAVINSADSEMRQTFQRVVDYQDRVLNYLRDSGVLSSDAYDAIKAANKSYVPFFRLMADDPNAPVGQSKSLRNPVMRYKGSDRKVIDPIESIIKNTYLYLELAEKNAANTALVDEVQGNPEIADLVKKVPTPIRPVEVSEEETAKFLTDNGLDPKDAAAFTIFRPQSVPLKDTEFVVYRDGKREIYETTKEIASAVRSLDRESISLWMKVMGAPARVLRAGAVLSPDFVLRNPIRDQFSAFVFSKDGYIPYLDMVRGAVSLVKKDADFQNWLKSGGANSALVSVDRQYIHENVFKLNHETGFMDSVWNVAKSPIEFLRIASELMENATRLGEFKKAAEGATTKEDIQNAGYQSREVTLDFARAGTQSRALNLISAFYNAQIQGVDRTIRAVKDNPTGTMARIAVSITLPSVLLWMANHDDDWVAPDGSHHNRWKELASWERDLFWIILTKDHIFRIPKPFEQGVIFGSGVERALDAIVGQADKKGVHEFLKTMGSGLIPNPTPTVVSPILEHITNHSFLSGHDLIPARLEKLLPEFRYTDYTTETAKFLGHVFSALPSLRNRSIVSPMVMENYLRHWTGGLGNYALQLADASLRKSGMIPDPVMPERSLAQLPVIKAFMIRYPSASAESLSKFQEDYAKRKMSLDTVKMLATQGDINAVVLMNSLNPNELVTLDGIHKALSEHTQMIHMINKMDLSPDKKGDKVSRENLAKEKRQLIDGAYSNMIEMSRMGNDIMKQIDETMQKR